MKTHVELLGLINVISGLLSAIVGLIVFALFTVLVPVTGDPTGSLVLLMLGVGVGGFLVILGIPTVIAGIGLLKLKPWSRLLALIVAIVAFFNFPLGTLVAIYTAWVLTNNEVVNMLEAKV